MSVKLHHEGPADPTLSGLDATLGSGRGLEVPLPASPSV